MDWPAHIATLTAFWAWQLLGEDGFDGNPLRSHEPVHARTPLTPSHGERWLELFCDTVDAEFAVRSPRPPRCVAARWPQPCDGCWTAPVG